MLALLNRETVNCEVLLLDACVELEMEAWKHVQEIGSSTKEAPLSLVPPAAARSARLDDAETSRTTNAWLLLMTSEALAAGKVAMGLAVGEAPLAEALSTR